MFFFKKKERTNYGKIFAITVAIVAATCAVACAVSCVVCKLLGKYLSFGVCEDDRDRRAHLVRRIVPEHSGKS